jgi:Protein of unknown function VcgC/VcgE (DUF2780)
MGPGWNSPTMTAASARAPPLRSTSMGRRLVKDASAARTPCFLDGRDTRDRLRHGRAPFRKTTVRAATGSAARSTGCRSISTPPPRTPITRLVLRSDSNWRWRASDPDPSDDRINAVIPEVTMTRQSWLSIVCIGFVVVTAPIARAHVSQLPQDAQKTSATEAASAAVKASPELVGALSKEIGATPEQAAGAAGALFGVAKSRLKPDEFSQVASAVPGMDMLLKAAPAAPAATGVSGALSQAAGSASGLAGAASAFTKLGLKPDMVGKAVPVLTSFVTKSGGANVGNLLAGALK